MKYSYNWLKELSGVNLPAQKAAEMLTMHSFELEKFEENKLESIIVGEILEIKKHPNADKLSLVEVNIKPSLLTSLPKGERESRKVLHIVCGASNIKVGDKVPVAMIGTIFPSGLVIKEAEIRGEKSSGMLCAQDELGLGKDHSGILILPKNAKAGTPIEKYISSKDAVIEIKVLPDRAHDALSHVGVARELAALSGRKLEYDYDGLKLMKKRSKKLSIEIKDGNLCPRYIGALLQNIQIKESPKWMQERLSACGMRPINNVVDATNYIVLETGHPLHAFDLEKVSSEIPNPKSQILNKSKIQNSKFKILVRKAKPNEQLELLDKTKLNLTGDDLLITNGEQALGLAGIMGGKDSGIYETTKSIVVESANFYPVGIRKTRMRHRLKTEASDRYEKGLDPNLAEVAMTRVIEILEHTADAKLEGVVDVYPKKIKSWKIRLDLKYVDNLLGEEVPVNHVIKILNLLGVEVKSQKSKVKSAGKNSKVNKILECIIPTIRLDLRTQEDLVEEIGRLWGYEKIEPQPLIEAVTPPAVNKLLAFSANIKERLVTLGFDEMYNYSFYSKKDAEKCGLGDINHFELANPMNPDQELVRASLAPNILKNIENNLKYFDDLNIFEIGRAYFPDNNSVKEKRFLTMARVAQEDKNAQTFYALKSSLSVLFESVGIKDVIFNAKKKAGAMADPERIAEIVVNNINIGAVGEIKRLVLDRFKIKKRVAMAEIDLENFFDSLPKEKTYSPLRKFPVIIRDISLITDPNNTAADIEKFIKAKGGNLVLSVELFDVFQKESKNSLAFRITFGADRTLESDEADRAMEKIILGLEKELKVEIRK